MNIFIFKIQLRKCYFLFFYTAYESFRDVIPENERDDFLTAYHKRLNSKDIAMQVGNL